MCENKINLGVLVMPTKKPRFNITFEPSEINMLTLLAKKKHKSISTLARELILDALERHEDMVLSAVGDERVEEFQKKLQKTVSHEKAWK
jgi:predicted DNA-binding protein